MDTKLKKLSKRQIEILLGTGIFLELIFINLTYMYGSYRSMGAEENINYYYWTLEEVYAFFRATVGFGTMTVVFGIGIGVLLHEYLKKWPLKSSLRFSKVDRIWTEAVILLLLLSGIVYLQAFPAFGRNIYVWWGYILDNLYDISRYLLRLALCLAILLFSLCMAVRKVILGKVQETSFICQMIKQYKNSTSLEKRLQNKLRMILAAGGIATAGILLLIFGPWSFYVDQWIILSAVLSILVFLLLLKACLQNPLARDAGYLDYQIYQISQGEKLDEAYRLPENSLLKEAENRLENIEAAMAKSVEKQVQAERLKAELLTNMSHDLKTPLTSMVGYTDLLKQEELSDQARDYVEAISLKQEQLKDMIQDLFDLSKAASGSEQLNLEILDMNRLLEQTLGDMEDAIANSGRDIRSKLSQEPVLFCGDNLKMYRVVQNLLENALKYSMENTRIYIETKRQGDRIRTEMKNIASYEMDFAPEEIMERFVRGDKARTTQGHGLGLAIASAYAANMGGKLEIEIDGDLFKVIMEFPVTEEKGGNMHGQDFNSGSLL